MEGNLLRKLNNKGVSLVELIIGVAILGLIIIPLTNTLLSSARTLSRSKEIGSVTLLGQSFSESINANSIEKLLSDPSAVLNMEATIENENSTYTINIDDIPIENSTYSAKIIVNNSDEFTDTENQIYGSLNSKEMMNYIPFDIIEIDSYINSATSGTGGTTEGTTGGTTGTTGGTTGTTGGTTGTTGTQDRKIVIRIVEGTALSVEISYFLVNSDGSEVEYKERNTHFFNKRSVGRYPNIYFFYQPYYSESGKDIIEIVNMLPEYKTSYGEIIPLNVFLVKQSDEENVPTRNYQLNVNVKQQSAYGNFDNLFTRIYTNAGEKSSPEDVTTLNPIVNLFNSNDNFVQYNDLNEYENFEFSNNLYPTSLYTRAYDIDIQIYNDSGDVVYDISTIKLN